MVQEGSGTDQEAPLGVVLEGVQLEPAADTDQTSQQEVLQVQDNRVPGITSDKRSATLRHSFPQVPVFGFRDYWESIRLDSN